MHHQLALEMHRALLTGRNAPDACGSAAAAAAAGQGMESSEMKSAYLLADVLFLSTNAE